MHLDLIGRSDERDRRPSPAELDRLTGYAEANPRQFIPLARIIRFAVATAMRQDETHRMDRRGFAETYRENSGRKDPRRKDGKTIKLSHCSTQPVTMLADRACAADRHSWSRSGVPAPLQIGRSNVPSRLQGTGYRRPTFSRPSTRRNRPSFRSWVCAREGGVGNGSQGFENVATLHQI